MPNSSPLHSVFIEKWNAQLFSSSLQSYESLVIADSNSHIRLVKSGMPNSAPFHSALMKG